MIAKRLRPFLYYSHDRSESPDFIEVAAIPSGFPIDLIVDRNPFSGIHGWKFLVFPETLDMTALPADRMYLFPHLKSPHLKYTRH
jgi:hypothetical protein